MGTIFCYCYVRESRGLTDSQKKNLYTPKHLIDEQKPEGRGIEFRTLRQSTMAPEESAPIMVSTHVQTNFSLPADQDHALFAWGQTPKQLKNHFYFTVKISFKTI